MSASIWNPGSPLFNAGAATILSTVTTETLQAAIDRVSALGGGEVLCAPGNWSIGLIYMRDNVRLRGYGQTTRFIFNRLTGVGAMFRVENVSNVVFEDLTLDNNGALSVDGVGASTILHRGTTKAADNIVIRNCYFQGGVIRPYIDFRSSFASRGVRIEGCEFLGKATLTPRPPPNSQTIQGIRFLCATGCGDWTITGNDFRLCGNAVQIRHESANAFDRFDTVSINDNEMFEVPEDPNVGTSPFEIFCVTAVTVTGNTIHSGGRGFNGTYVKAGTYAGNTCYDQTKYFCEIQSCDGLTFDGNTAYNCKTFVNDTSATGNPGSKNIVISDNVIRGGSIGEIGYDAYTLTNCITGISVISGYENWTITGNLIEGMRYQSSAIRVDGVAPKNWLIANNQFIQTELTSNPTAIAVIQGDGVTIRNNRIIRTVDIDDTTSNTNSKFSFIAVRNTNVSNVIVEENEIRWSGVDARTAPNDAGLIGIGGNEGAAAATGISVRRNKIVGGYAHPLKLPYTSVDLVVEDNDLSEATGTNAIESTTILRRLKRQVEGTAAPTTGTWGVGDYCRNSVPAVGQPKGWYCTVAGTPGTWVSEGNL